MKWSRDVGWRHFCEAVAVAYKLQEIYTEGVAATGVNAKLVTGWKQIAWINCLFNEQFFVKNYDPWKLFEAVHYASDAMDRNYGYDFTNFVFGKDRCAIIGQCEIYAVLHGTKDALKKFSEEVEGATENLVLKEIAMTMEMLEFLAETEADKQTDPLNEFIKSIRKFYEQKTEENDLDDDDSIFSRLSRRCAYPKDEKRYLIGSWHLMDPATKNNKARVTLRRYMALVANKGLRNRVFDF